MGGARFRQAPECRQSRGSLDRRVEQFRIQRRRLARRVKRRGVTAEIIQGMRKTGVCRGKIGPQRKCLTVRGC